MTIHRLLEILAEKGHPVDRYTYMQWEWGLRRMPPEILAIYARELVTRGALYWHEDEPFVQQMERLYASTLGRPIHHKRRDSEGGLDVADGDPLAVLAAGADGEIEVGADLVDDLEEVRAIAGQNTRETE